MWQRIYDQIAALRLTDKFKMLGYREDMRKVYGRLDVYGMLLNPNTTAAAELNLQEAMASGLPIVMLPIGGPQYMIEDGVSGIIAAGPGNTSRQWSISIITRKSAPASAAMPMNRLCGASGRRTPHAGLMSFTQRYARTKPPPPVFRDLSATEIPKLLMLPMFRHFNAETLHAIQNPKSRIQNRPPIGCRPSSRPTTRRSS